MGTVQCPSCGQQIQVASGSSATPWIIGCLVVPIALMVVTAIIGMLAAIAIPSFVKARNVSQMNACINNMRVIDAAKEQAALANGYKMGAAIPESAMQPYLPDGVLPECPAGGVYSIGPLGQDPECSEHGALSDAHEPY